VLTYFRCASGKIERRPGFSAADLSDFPNAQHWIDLEDPTPEEAKILEEVFHFHPLAIEDTVTDIQHPKIDDYGDYAFMVVHGVRYESPKDSFVTRELDIFLGHNYIITHHEGMMRSIRAAQEQCDKNWMTSMHKGVDFLAHQILDQLFEHYFPVVDAIDARIDELQEEVFKKPEKETLDKIFALKRDISMLRRFCMPQREIVHRLARGEVQVVSPKASIYFRDIHDNLYRIVEASYAHQDQAQSTLDAYLTGVSNQLNETMKRLTVISALLAPMTVITGYWGMNFDHMPELRLAWGPALPIGLMAAASGGLLYYFKRRGWI
jgi:magnesium transporter